MKCDNRQPSCQVCDVHGKPCVYDELPRRPRSVFQKEKVTVLRFFVSILNKPGLGFLNITYNSRPSHSRISQLEEENKQLRLSLSVLSCQTGHRNVGHSHLADNSSEQRSPDNPSSQSGGMEPADGLRSSSQVSTLAGSTVGSVLPASMPENKQPSGNLSSMEPRVVLAEGEPRYHGPTSTLFEDGSGDRRAQQNVTGMPKIPPAWVQKSLMAEAASQRMLLKPCYFVRRFSLKL